MAFRPAFPKGPNRIAAARRVASVIFRQARPLTAGSSAISIFSVKSADLTITELAASVPKAVRDTEELGVRGITRNGRAVAFLVSRQVMESILETMELQRNSTLMNLIKADKAGKVAFSKVSDEG
jgi:hypothetical protein